DLHERLARHDTVPERDRDARLDLALLVEREHLEAQGTDRREARALPDRVRSPLVDPEEALLERRGEQVVLAREVVLERPVRVTRLRRDLTHRHRLDAPARDEPPRCLDDLPATLLVVDTLGHGVRLLICSLVGLERETLSPRPGPLADVGEPVDLE